MMFGGSFSINMALLTELSRGVPPELGAALDLSESRGKNSCTIVRKTPSVRNIPFLPFSLMQPVG